METDPVDTCSRLGEPGGVEWPGIITAKHIFRLLANQAIGWHRWFRSDARDVFELVERNRRARRVDLTSRLAGISALSSVTTRSQKRR